MVVSLSYDFSTFLLMENSCATIHGYDDMFESVRQPYVFTIVFLSYPMYSHDFSCFSRGITFHGRSPIGSFSEELKSEEHFSEDAVW
jgi:hypothetical protein